MKVVIGYIRDDQVGPALDSFKTGKDRVHAIKVNVVDRAAMKAAADEIEAKFGKIHLLSNNAGIGPLTALIATEPKDFDQTIAVNLTGVYNGIHEFVPRIRKHGEGGHVVTTSSMSGILPTEGGGAGAYTASKFAITGMMEILRSELDGLDGERDIGLTAQDDDGQVRHGGEYFLERADPLRVRQREIEEHNIDPVLPERLNGLCHRIDSEDREHRARR